MPRDNNLAKGFFIGFLAGGTVGAIIALLTAPKSGKELRADIKSKSEEYLDEAEKYLAEAKDKARELINEGKKKSERIILDAKSKSEDILKDAEKIFKDAKVKTTEAFQAGKEKVESEAERLKSSVKAGIDAYKEAKNS
ncbi:MAG: YtxH domain-containing protein [Ignavibacterium sp.]|jgi:gas vesicle protein|nr:YtxH domain-containing protein [Ignavibacterium sp.]